MNAIHQSGAIIVRQDKCGPSILLIQAEKTDDAWIFPKGHVECGESPERAAIREAREETGVRGDLISQVGHPLDFTSGNESVIVHYFLIYARHEGESVEHRVTKWFSLSDAKQQLAYADARELLESVEPTILRWMVSPLSQDNRITELMLAEYNHIGESLLRNEDSGERRVTFFLSFAGAVGTALGFLTGDHGPLTDYFPHLVILSLLILIVFGYSTIVRIITRNAASDVYKRSLTRVRQYFLHGADDPQGYFMAFSPFEHAWRKPLQRWNVGSGGWLPTMVSIPGPTFFPL